MMDFPRDTYTAVDIKVFLDATVILYFLSHTFDSITVHDAWQPPA